ncbi:hypothetical protein LXA43DRAFT_1111219 [Ganoderma leucocontextum]|nr:hypothetical protein LXA43DRAFT_1111219 [Ganoderma leucocontextum]
MCYYSPGQYIPPLPSNTIPDIIGAVDIPFDTIWCPICARQIVPKRIQVPVQPRPTPPQATVTQSKTAHHQDTSVRLTGGKTVSRIRPREGFVHRTSRVKSNKAIKGSPTEDAPENAPPNARSDSIPAPKPAAPVRHRMVIDQTPAPLYCSDACRLADLQSCHIDIKHNAARCTSPRLPPDLSNTFSVIHGSQNDSDCSSGASYNSSSFASSITASPTAQASPSNGDCGADAYSHLSAFYGFAPLPPPPPFTPKASTSGGIMLAARRIEAALFTTTKKFCWGLPVDSDNNENDSKPIPGWTDGSNAWRASVYGFAPPRDFTRTDPDYDAIRAYGSYVATPHRSHGVHSTLSDTMPAAEVKTSGLLPAVTLRAIDAPTQKLYRQYSVSFTRWTSIHTRYAGRSTSPASSTCSSLAREVPILKPGAEGRLLVPDVKLRRVNFIVSSIGCSSGTSWGRQRATFSNASAAGLNGEHNTASRSGLQLHLSARTQSYSSEMFTYPIMRIAPKKEKHIERRLVDGVERDVEVEVLVEEPIKRLFLFGGALN